MSKRIFYGLLVGRFGLQAPLLEHGTPNEITDKHAGAKEVGRSGMANKMVFKIFKNSSTTPFQSSTDDSKTTIVPLF